MKFHEKSLELNITHELLNLTDSWYWFLSEIPLWRYWRPRFRLPFLKFPKSTCGGFHITSEGKSDSTGKAGGGYDVRIKSGLGGNLLFIQYKQGELLSSVPDPKSIFATAPHEHFKFKINSIKTNQHFLLRELANDIGKIKGNAVVYALPLINDMDDLEKNAGNLIRKTKFISIKDLDAQAILNKVTIAPGKEHNFRICNSDMDRCEMNYFYFQFKEKDKAPELIADLITLSFQKNLSYFINQIEESYKDYELYEGYISRGLSSAFGQYLRFLLHYFEVTPDSLSSSAKSTIDKFGNSELLRDEFNQYQSNKRDIEIIEETFNALNIFTNYIQNPVTEKGEEFVVNKDIPNYQPVLFTSLNQDGFSKTIGSEYLQEDLENVSYLIV